ncbi:glycosyltransferase WbuB [Vibrio cholerae]|nr:glycosyltransferase WbuB [Vibrio cholerae]
MSKTVWYISKYFAQKTQSAPGGRGWFLLKGLADLGFQSVAICSDSNVLIEPISIHGSSKIEELEGVKICWLKTSKYKVAKSIKRIISWFHFEYRLFFFDNSKLPTPDVIVVSSLSILTVLNGLRLKRKYKCRLIFEVRDIWPLTIVEEGGFSQYNPFVLFLSLIEKMGYKYSDAIIGTMPNLAEHVANVCKTSKPVYCIPMGFSEEQLYNQCNIDEDYYLKYLSSEKFKIVHAGTIGITNALDVFFKTAEKLVSNDEIEFIIVGDGPLKSFYFSKYGHLSNVVFAPKVNKDQVQAVLSHCDLVYFSVFPSKVWEYGQSLNKVIDYMLSGKPILASYYGYPSMINEAECGYFVPSGDSDSLKDKIVELSQMPKSLRNELGQRGRDWLFTNRTYKHLSIQFSKILFPS